MTYQMRYSCLFQHCANRAIWLSASRRSTVSARFLQLREMRVNKITYRINAFQKENLKMSHLLEKIVDKALRISKSPLLCQAILFPRPAVLLILLFLLASTAIAEGPILVRYAKMPDTTDIRNIYPLQILNLILKKSGAQYQLVPVEMKILQGRVLKELEFGRMVDIEWAMTSIESENKLLPIRIPIDKGLLGIRLLLIHKDNVSKFSHVKSIEDLKRFKAGQGHDWPDYTILIRNGLPTIGSPSYEGLFLMVEQKRIDYFPRSADEIWAEAEQYKDHSIVIEPTLMLHYPTAEYFFVNKSNKMLADLLLRGFNIAIQDGSFERLFLQHNQKILKVLNGRTIIELKNPILPAETPLSRKELWYKVK